MNSSLCLPGVLRDPCPFCPGTTLVASIAQIDPGLRCSFSCHIHGANSKMENEGEEAATSGKFSEATTWHFHFHSISQNLVTQLHLAAREAWKYHLYLGGLVPR